LDVLLGTFLVGVVAAIGEHDQLPVEKMAVESHALFDVKNEARVREIGRAHV